MKHFLLAFSLLAILAVTVASVGCDAPAEVSTNTTDTTDTAGLLMEVDKDALESALATNNVTLIKFTAVW